MSTFGFHTTAEEATIVLADEITGKKVLITGTSLNGLGFEAARTIAKHANLVIITGYNAERTRLKRSEVALKQEIPGANIRSLHLDLASLAAVRTAAAEVNAYKEDIHVLINNAASPVCGFKLTKDGYEQQIATDHLGPFLFTALILPKIIASHRATFTPRVVYVASGSHKWCDGMNFAEMEHPDASTYKAMTAYGQAKTANILTASELTRRAGGKINAYSLTPGGLTVGARYATISGRRIITEDGKPNMSAPLPWKTLPEGAATLVTAAFDPSLNDKPGCYLIHSAEDNQNVAPHASDPSQAEKLWTLSERLVGVKFL
ncbi:short-chain dehydrogenase [Mycena alexandri]|uniref:Short-chain dehydrogenase n=1 Tax=Mycena alexandri TaxID=1745969 RepID=A0AAD6WUS7_9AGAR|nr:short-chain dehydrogenase [Mycena alexandri]